MCIAIAKMAGQDIPNKDILENCWMNNDDGAGFAFNHNNKVYIKKGFMDFESFYKAFMENNDRFNFKDKGLLIHFRITTHGGTSPAMTHPFPIVADNGCLSKTEYISDYAVIHNGVISMTTSVATREKVVSDTAVFIRDYLTSLSSNRDWFRNKMNFELIYKMIDSKMAIIDKSGNIQMTAGFTEDEGIFYSNSSYKDTYVRYSAAYSGGYKYENGKYVYDDNYLYDDYEYGVNTPHYKASKSSNNTKFITSLMKIQWGSMVECSGFSEIAGEREYDWFMDKHSSLYISDKPIGKEKRSFFYMGEGLVFDRLFKQVVFKADTFASDEQFFDE